MLCLHECVWHNILSKSHCWWWFCVCEEMGEKMCCGRKMSAVTGSEQRTSRWSQRTAARKGKWGQGDSKSTEEESLSCPTAPFSKDKREAFCQSLDKWCFNSDQSIILNHFINVMESTRVSVETMWSWGSQKASFSHQLYDKLDHFRVSTFVRHSTIKPNQNQFV